MNLSSPKYSSVYDFPPFLSNRDDLREDPLVTRKFQEGIPSSPIIAAGGELDLVIV
jgi:hypothetical protein